VNKIEKYINKEISDFNREEVIKLQEIIKYHNNLYYNKQEPTISDFEYDSLFKKLKIIENQFDIKNKITDNIGSIIKESTFEKVKHSRPMISLDNTYNEDDLNDFDIRINKLIWNNATPNIEYTIEFKFDWLGVELIYEKWILIRAITRWNWIEWEDVTENVMMIENIPKIIKYKGDLEVRGEVVMPISSFNNINKKAKITWWKIFSNPRNAASWSLRTIDIDVTKERKLMFFAYDLANFKEFVDIEKKDFYFDVINDINWLGFDISSYFIKCKNILEIKNEIDNFWDTKKKIDFEIDWLVLKVNDIKIWEKIGSTEHHPRYAIAYKFPAEILTTKIINVKHSIWRTGTITPVAILEPINIWWVIVKRASLHNYEEIDKLWIKIGDSIFIKRAWEVIPKVISVIKEERIGIEKDIKIPVVCPSCKSNIFKDDDRVRYYCGNYNWCFDQISEKLAYSIGKQGFNIDHFWKKQIRLFLEKWFVKILSDIFDLKSYREELLSLDWFQEKSVNKLFLSIEKSKNIDIIPLITALWIRWVGKKTAKELAKVLKSKENMLEFSLSIEDLESLSDIWSEIANEVYNYFTNECNMLLLTKLLDILNIKYINKSQVVKWWFFEWKKVCITWSFDNYKRDNLIKILENNWWEFMSSVSKQTNFLLAWEKAGSKLKKAQELWVEVLNVYEFIEKCEF